jgi:hypothetical protein
MMTDEKRRDRKPGENPPGKFHYNPGNMAGKTAETTKDGCAEEEALKRAPQRATKG